MENAHQGHAGEDAAHVGEEVVPVASAARAEELTKFQGGAEQEEKDHGRADVAAAEFFQIGEGGQECVGR